MAKWTAIAKGECGRLKQTPTLQNWVNCSGQRSNCLINIHQDYVILFLKCENSCYLNCTSNIVVCGSYI